MTIDVKLRAEDAIGSLGTINGMVTQSQNLFNNFNIEVARTKTLLDSVGDLIVDFGRVSLSGDIEGFVEDMVGSIVNTTVSNLFEAIEGPLEISFTPSAASLEQFREALNTVVDFTPQETNEVVAEATRQAGVATEETPPDLEALRYGLFQSGETSASQTRFYQINPEQEGLGPEIGRESHEVLRGRQTAAGIRSVSGQRARGGTPEQRLAKAQRDLANINDNIRTQSEERQAAGTFGTGFEQQEQARVAQPTDRRATQQQVRTRTAQEVTVNVIHTPHQTMAEFLRMLNDALDSNAELRGLFI